MAKNNSLATQASRSFPIFSILTLIFVLAKIFGKITWSWWVVFAPLWIPAGSLLAFLFLFIVVALLLA